VVFSGFTLRDVPWQTGRFGTSFFDREGTPTSDRLLIENGVLRSFLLDRYSANALGLATTGNAQGGPAGPPAVGAHCLEAGAGDEAETALLGRTTQAQSQFLKVHRFSGQVDPITGDFSGVAKGGEWWSGGERVRFVKETLISGNVFECLRDGVFGLSHTPQVVDCQEAAPALVASGVSVTSSS